MPNLNARPTFQFRDPRSTRLLNNSNKDDLGWQNNHVLFGFHWRFNPNNDNSIIIGPGAIYTQNGVKVFVSEEFTVDVQISTFGQGSDTQFPYPKNLVIGIRHSYQAVDTGAMEPEVVLISLRVSQDDQEPAYNIKKIDMITGQISDDDLVDPDRFSNPGNNGVYDFTVSGTQTDGQTLSNYKNNRSIHNDVTPIIKLSLITDPSGSLPSTLKSGYEDQNNLIKIVRYKNIFRQINDLVGVNIFEPKDDVDQLLQRDSGGNIVSGYNMSPSSQGSGYAVKGDIETPNSHPLYGVFENINRAITKEYRFASFLMDGESMIDGMKRLDAFMRMLVNISGSQQLVQNHSDSFKGLRDIIESHDSGEQYQYNSSNYILRNGVIRHIPVSSNESDSGLADSHKKALMIFDRCFNFLANRLGLNPAVDRDDIEASIFTSQAWDTSNPPGKDIDQNASYASTIEKIRENWLSRGDDVHTGGIVFSEDDSDRDGVYAANQGSIKALINRINLLQTNGVTSSERSVSRTRFHQDQRHAQYGLTRLDIENGDDKLLYTNGTLDIESGNGSVKIEDGTGLASNPATLDNHWIRKGEHDLDIQAESSARDQAIADAVDPLPAAADKSVIIQNVNGVNTIRLLNDEFVISGARYYGTNQSGVRGYHEFAAQSVQRSTYKDLNIQLKFGQATNRGWGGIVVDNYSSDLWNGNYIRDSNNRSITSRPIILCNRYNTPGVPVDAFFHSGYDGQVILTTGNNPSQQSNDLNWLLHDRHVLDNNSWIRAAPALELGDSPFLSDYPWMISGYNGDHGDDGRPILAYVTLGQAIVFNDLVIGQSFGSVTFVADHVRARVDGNSSSYQSYTTAGQSAIDQNDHVDNRLESFTVPIGADWTDVFWAHAGYNGGNEGRQNMQIRIYWTGQTAGSITTYRLVMQVRVNYYARNRNGTGASFNFQVRGQVNMHGP